MPNKLTIKQKAFADYYIECGNATEAARKAGYSEKYLNTNANKLLQNTTISSYIAERTKPTEQKRIATGDEIMMFFTRVMYGEEKDAFGLDPSLQDRLNAAKELAKRIVDVGAAKEEYENDNFLEALKDDVKSTFEKAGDIVET
ncbi:MAG: terminase small subunit [Clostridiales bacterium]|nr:terminase small subunit [Roseburia sp.]MDD7635378.1 terminase small subunit [Clostridiales bacterium]